MRLVFDERTNGQAVMHYSRHRLTTSVVYATIITHVRFTQLLGLMNSPCLPIDHFVKKLKASCQLSSIQLRRSVRAFT